MNRSLTSLAFAGIASLLLTSCSPDNFSSGWDSQVVATTVSLIQSSSQDIHLGTINLQDDVVDFLNVNQPDAQSFTILEVVPATGSVVSTNLFNLNFVEDLNIYAVQDNRELLIGRLGLADVSRVPSAGIEGVNQNLFSFGENDDIELILRPAFTEIGTQTQSLDIEVRFALNYSVTGMK